MASTRAPGLPLSPASSDGSSESLPVDSTQYSSTDGVLGFSSEEVTRLTIQRDLEDDISRWVEAEDCRLGRVCESAKIQMSMVASKCFVDSELFFHFIAGFKYTEFIQDWRRLLPYAVPVLVEGAMAPTWASVPSRKRRRGARPRLSVTKSHTEETETQGLRRSARLRKQRTLL
ncbi:hypothetical protein BDR22DRAFT_825380 [Usnea florida]